MSSHPLIIKDYFISSSGRRAPRAAPCVPGGGVSFGREPGGTAGAGPHMLLA